MRGSIEKVFVKKGEFVSKGTPLMKINNIRRTSLVSRDNGRMKKIYVKEGDQITHKQLLIEIDSNGDEDDKVKELKINGIDSLEKEYINKRESMTDTKIFEETPSKKIKLTNKEHVKENEEQGVRF